jgi:hypothetical protein
MKAIAEFKNIDKCLARKQSEIRSYQCITTIFNKNKEVEKKKFIETKTKSSRTIQNGDNFVRSLHLLGIHLQDVNS